MITALPGYRYPFSWTTHSPHVWIDPDAPRLQRRPLSLIIGNGPRQMRPGHTYRCRDCGHEMTIPERLARAYGH